MSGVDNLIPIPNRTMEEQKRIHSMGGSVKSPAKKIAAKLRWLKQKGLKDATAKRLFELMTNPDLTDLDILIFLESLKSTATDDKSKIELVKLYLKWREIRHGSKLNIESSNTNLNLGLDLNSIVSIAEEVKQEESVKDDSK